MANISIQSLFNHRYIKQKPNSTLTCKGCHPYLTRSSVDKNKTTFRIFNPNENKHETLKFCMNVYLISLDGRYLSADPNGSVSLERGAPDNAHPERKLMKFRKWAVLNAKSPISKKEIVLTDEVIFKSPFNKYLKNDRGDLTANAELLTDEIRFSIKKAEEFALPAWSVVRPYNSGLFLTHDCAKLLGQNDVFFRQLNYEGGKGKAKIHFTNNTEAERHVLEELVYALISQTGQFIKRFYDDSTGYSFYEFTENEGFDINFVQMVNRILPLAGMHDFVKLFEELKGAVNKSLNLQGFCEGLFKIRQEYYNVVNMIEDEFKNNRLDIQKLWFYLQSPMKIFENVKKILQEINKGQKHELTILYDHIRIAVDKLVYK